jgi:hypothetical protein
MGAAPLCWLARVRDQRAIRTMVRTKTKRTRGAGSCCC